MTDERSPHRVLFYPGSGRDLLTPVKLFAPWVREFWFVDLHYFPERRPMSRTRPLLYGDDRFRLVEVRREGPDGASCTRRFDEAQGAEIPWIDPSVLTEEYECDGIRILVHRRRGFWRNFYRNLLGRIDVFFHRRDSPDGGRVFELGYVRNLTELLGRLGDGGLLVTDGSLQPRREFRSLGAFHLRRDLGSEVVLQAQDVVARGYRLRCVGYAGEGYGPTLIWRVSREHNSAKESS